MFVHLNCKEGYGYRSYNIMKGYQLPCGLCPGCVRASGPNGRHGVHAPRAAARARGLDRGPAPTWSAGQSAAGLNMTRMLSREVWWK